MLNEGLVVQPSDTGLEDVCCGRAAMRRMPTGVEPGQGELLLLPTQRPVLVLHRPRRLPLGKVCDPGSDLRLTRSHELVGARQYVGHFVLRTELTAPAQSRPM
ncbi:MAG: hypothetical protein R2719_01770 [Micropruina sp.]